MSSVVLRGPVRFGHYPLREETRPDRVETTLQGIAWRCSPWRRHRARQRMQQFVQQVAALDRSLSMISDDDLRARIPELRYGLRRDSFQSKALPEVFAVIRECSRRRLGLRHFDEQVGVSWLLLQRVVVEFATGEGKTLAATLAACAAALAGSPVHLITANNYLAQRDAELMKPLYATLGLTVGVATQSMTDIERRQAYQADVVYTSNKIIAFDYIRDRLALAAVSGSLMGSDPMSQTKVDLFLPGLQFAIVDEADGVLVDDARTPLIIARENPASTDRQTLAQALAFARTLRAESDFAIDRHSRYVMLTDAGRQRLEQFRLGLPGPWLHRQRAEEIVTQSLSALHVFVRDRDYLVSDGKVRIIDENTGRLWADRSWERGLHQLIECNEGCDLSGERETLASSTYQSFFRRYIHLCGMTGTAREVAGELHHVYGLDVVSVATRLPCLRQHGAPQLYARREAKLGALLAATARVSSKRRPVLIGTRSVADSELLSQRLTLAGLTHQLLNARQDQAEAELIARAGNPRCITVATNMAGRGTDIKLDEVAAANGGLHVILAELNEARRVDRQLFGRCARQGDPGSTEVIISLEDRVFQTTFPVWMLSLLTRLWPERPVPVWLARLLASISQQTLERRRAQQRKSLLVQAAAQAQRLAFFRDESY